MEVHGICNAIKSAQDIVRQAIQKSDNQYIQAYMAGMSTAFRLTFQLFRDEISENEFITIVEKYANNYEIVELSI